MDLSRNTLLGTLLEIQLLGAASKRASVFPSLTGRFHKYTENAAEPEANACGSEARARGAPEPERRPACAPSPRGLGFPRVGAGPRARYGRRRPPSRIRGCLTESAHLCPAPTSGTQPHSRLLTSPLRASHTAVPKCSVPLGTRLSLAASGVPATVCQRKSGCQQRAAARQVPGRQSPGRAARAPHPRPPGSPTPARRANVCAPGGAAPSLSAPGLCELPGPDGGAGGSGAPALGRPFPELARPG